MRIDRQKGKDKHISKGTAINSGASPEGSFMLLSDLTFFFFFGYAAWHVGSQFSHQGLNPHPLQWKCGVLTTGLPGKSWSHLLNSLPQCWVVFACMNAHAYTCVTSFCEPSSIAAATEASEWWQLIMNTTPDVSLLSHLAEALHSHEIPQWIFVILERKCQYGNSCCWDS